MNPPTALQGAMTRDRKPFTYTPGGLDLSEIKSERMAKRLMRNAMNQGVQEVPVNQPVKTPTTPTTPISVPNYNCLPVQVFPAFQLPPNPKSLLRTRSTSVQREPLADKKNSQTPNHFETKLCSDNNFSETKQSRINPNPASIFDTSGYNNEFILERNSPPPIYHINNYNQNNMLSSLDNQNILNSSSTFYKERPESNNLTYEQTPTIFRSDDSLNHDNINVNINTIDNKEVVTNNLLNKINGVNDDDINVELEHEYNNITIQPINLKPTDDCNRTNGVISQSEETADELLNQVYVFLIMKNSKYVLH